LFRRRDALALFGRVFRQAEGRYRFEVRTLHLDDDWLTFYILPADGFELPDIMKWLKQVFAQRFNVKDGRIGHVWGDRYWSEILEGEPPEEEGATEGEEEGNPGVRPRYGGKANPGVRPQQRENPANLDFLLVFPFPNIPPPA
jgi:hypothetical protein